MEKVTLRYPGSIENFRALIDELRMGNKSAWVSPNGETLAIWDERDYSKNKNPKTTGWWVASQIVDSEKKNGQGIILAFESVPNITSIDFYDGKTYNSFFGLEDQKKIGESFEELIRVIREKWEKSDMETTQKEIWEQIPNIGWYREAIRLWHERKTTSEIASILDKREQTVRNKIAELRKLYGEEIVPKRRQ